jgi:hypothetical protein
LKVKLLSVPEKDPCKILAISAKFLSSRRYYFRVFRHRNRRFELVRTKGGHLDVGDIPPDLSKSLSGLFWRAENKGLDGFEVPSRSLEVVLDFGEVDRA